MPLFLLDPEQLRSPKKPVPKIGLCVQRGHMLDIHDGWKHDALLHLLLHLLLHSARPKPPPFFDGLREKEREMVARRLLLKHVGIPV